MAFDRFLILWLLWLLFFSTGLSFVFTGQLENSFSIFYLCFNLVFGVFQVPLSFDICGMIICAGHFLWAQFCKNCLNGPFFICVVSKFLLWWNIYSLICFHLWPHHSCRSFVDGLNLGILFLGCLQAYFSLSQLGSILALFYFILFLLGLAISFGINFVRIFPMVLFDTLSRFGSLSFWGWPHCIFS